jgi:hypothetical protein
VPVVVALALRALSTVAVAIFVVEPPRHHLDPAAVHVPAAAWRRPAPVRPRGARRRPWRPRLVGTHVGLRALVLIEVLWGAGMLGVELYCRSAAERGSWAEPPKAVLLGITAAIAWSVCAAGAGMTTRIVTRAAHRLGPGSPCASPRAPPCHRRGRGWSGWSHHRLSGFYLVHGAANAVHYGMVHRLVPAAQRATILSISSLASRLGGVLAGLGVGWLASAAGLPAAFGVSAVLLAAAAPLYTVAGRAADALAEEPA